VEKTGGSPILPWKDLVESDETLRLRKSERSKERRVDDGKGRGVDADAEPKRQNNDGAEAWIASQRPDGMAKVVEKARHGRLDEKRPWSVVVRSDDFRFQ
jgi:hypothetical protein